MAYAIWRIVLTLNVRSEKIMELFVSQLHFIRPYWFYAIVPLLLITLFLLQNQKLSRSWQSVIDPKLLPHLLVGKSVKQSSKSSLIFFIIGLVVITSLAGPAWEKRPQPVFKEQSALVIALDLSRSMDAADIKPSRLARARHKITDILKKRKLGQTALLVYAADSYTVSPLTDDTATITSLLPSLTTALMPSQGTRTDKALVQAVALLENASIQHGDILLVTDGIESEATDAFKSAAKQHRISILAIATKEGAPIPQTIGGFVKDRRGAIVLPKLSISQLQKFSTLGKGYLTFISANDSDIIRLSSLFDKNRFEAENGTKETELKTDSWYEQGSWLLLLVIPLVLLSFRRGILVILVLILIQQPQPVYADSLWESLWFNADQRAEKLYKQDKAKEAAELFKDQQWKASALFKDKQYQKSIEALQGIDSADAHYNTGNAYAKLGEIEKAINEYNNSLKLNPNHEDALYNKKLLEEQKKNQSGKDKNKSTKDKKNNEDSSDPKSGDKGKQSDKQHNNSKESKSNDNSNSSNSESSNEESTNQESKKNESTKNSDPKEQQKGSDKDNKEEANNKLTEDKSKEKTEQKINQSQSSEEQSKQQKITQQWLRRIPDDPGGLLRNKFKYQYQRQQTHAPEENNW